MKWPSVLITFPAFMSYLSPASFHPKILRLNRLGKVTAWVSSNLYCCNTVQWDRSVPWQSRLKSWRLQKMVSWT